MPRSFDSVFYGAAGTSTGDPVDDEFNRVSFLAHMEGANNGVNNVFDDSSASNRTVTVLGKATQGSFGPFARPDGEWGVTFDGASDYLDANDGPTFGSGAFTIELFVNLRTLGSVQVFFDARPDSTNGLYPMLFVNSNNTLNYYVSSGARITSSETLSANRWYHVAVSRTSTSTKMFLDGTQVGSTYSDSNNYPDSGRMRVGTSSYSVGDGFHVNGVISNVRVVNSALYTSNFTAPTGKLTAVTNTKLLTCQSNRFVDNSADGLTMTPSGDTAVSAFGPFLTDAVYDPAVNGASAYFNGAGATSLLINSPPSSFGTSNFTIEAWVYKFASSGGSPILSQGDGDAVNTRAVSSFGVGSTVAVLQVYDPAGGNRILLQTAAGTIPSKSWNHIALTHQYTNSSSSTYKIWINGVLTSTLNHTGGYNWNSGAGSGNPIGINNYRFDGSAGKEAYMQDTRLVVGSLVYTSNFTPPTAPLTAITNTQLLLNMQDGQAIDSAAQDVLNFEGDAKISTGQAKFGDTSLYLSNSGNPKPLVEIYNSESRAFGTGDYTVETWIYIDGTPSQYAYIFDMRHGSSSPIDATEYTWALSFNYMGQTSDQLQWASNNTGPNAILSADYPPISEWVHIAVCRSGTTTRMFYNGTQSAINTNDSSDMRDTGQYGTIGARFSDEYHIDAYFDDIRFSKMARYTSNFTAPSAPFPDKGQNP